MLVLPVGVDWKLFVPILLPYIGYPGGAVVGLTVTALLGEVNIALAGI